MAFWIMFLTLRVARLRFERRVGLGDGGDKELARAIRVHANAVETQPIVWLLMLAYELGGGAAWLLHGCGAALLLGRFLHAYGLSAYGGSSVGRFSGTAIWSTVVVVLSIALLRHAVL